MSVPPDKISRPPRTRYSWNRIGFALSATIVGISIYVLANIVADIDFARVVTNVRTMPASRIGWASIVVACAYGTLSLYDLFALRTIGANHVPYRIAVLASFTSYAIGHNIGATAFSGGAIRYRIYSQFGLGVIEVAKICFLTGLTFWLGNLVVLGVGMTYWPDAPARILQLRPETVRVIGVIGLVLSCTYVAYTSYRPRTLGARNWSVVLPGGASILKQIVVGVADLGCSSLAMYAMIPSAGTEGFFIIAVAFVSATLLGFASLAPGSLGVFDAAMLVALPAIPKEELVAGLLLFRMIYFLIPFCVALIIMACWESLLLRYGREDSVKRTTENQEKLTADVVRENKSP